MTAVVGGVTRVALWLGSNLSGNHISDSIPPGFGNLANIATLYAHSLLLMLPPCCPPLMLPPPLPPPRDLSGNNLNSTIPRDLASVPTLTTL